MLKVTMVKKSDVWWAWQVIADNDFYEREYDCTSTGRPIFTYPRDMYYNQYTDFFKLRSFDDYYHNYCGEEDHLENAADTHLINGRLVWFNAHPEPKVLMFLSDSSRRGNCEVYSIHDSRNDESGWSPSQRVQHWVSSNPVRMPKCVQEAAKIAAVTIEVKRILCQPDCQKLINISNILTTDRMSNLPKNRFVEKQRQLLQNEFVNTVCNLLM